MTTRSAIADLQAQQIAATALYAEDGMDQWRRWVHSRCGPHPQTGEPITCPWCAEYGAKS